MERWFTVIWKPHLRKSDGKNWTSVETLCSKLLTYFTAKKALILALIAIHDYEAIKDQDEERSHPRRRKEQSKTKKEEPRRRKKNQDQDQEKERR